MKSLGILDATWRQKTLDVQKGGKLKLGGIKNNLVKTGRRTHRAEEFEESEITVTIPFVTGMDVIDLFSSEEGELIVKTDTGQTFSWPDAFLVNRPDLTGGEGGAVELKWNAGEPEALING